jgi:hypothetical protein
MRSRNGRSLGGIVGKRWADCAGYGRSRRARTGWAWLPGVGVRRATSCAGCRRWLTSSCRGRVSWWGVWWWGASCEGRGRWLTAGCRGRGVGGVRRWGQRRGGGVRLGAGRALRVTAGRPWLLGRGVGWGASFVRRERWRTARRLRWPGRRLRAGSGWGFRSAAVPTRAAGRSPWLSGTGCRAGRKPRRGRPGRTPGVATARACRSRWRAGWRRPRRPERLPAGRRPGG